VAEGAGPDEKRGRRLALWIALPYLSLGIVDALYAGRISDPMWLYWLWDFVEQVLVGFLLLWGILHFAGWRLRDIGIGWPEGRWPALRLLGYAVIATLLLMSSLTDRLTDAMGVVPPVDDDYDYSIVLPEGRGLRILAVLYLCAASSVIEEIFYRGVLWRAISPASSGLARQACFVLVSTAFFGASHTEQGLYGVISTGLWGAMCSVLLLLMRNLWPLIAGHAATNLYQFRYELLG